MLFNYNCAVVVMHSTRVEKQQPSYLPFTLLSSTLGLSEWAIN